MTKPITDFRKFVKAPVNDILIEWLEVILDIVEALFIEKHYSSQNEI
jgi:hypothetical protein